MLDLTIGPNPFVGFVAVALFSFLLAGALMASWLAVAQPQGSWRLAGLSWIVVAGYAGVFFVMPHFEHDRERTFLIRFLEKTLEAMPKSKQ